MSSIPSRRYPSALAAPLILHVTEAMGGGLEDAVHDFVRSAPQYRHALLFTRRGNFETSEHAPENLVEVVDAGRGFRTLRDAYGPVVQRLQPDVVHLHSAWAGLIGRTRRGVTGRIPVVYSPHSYYFDRQDILLPVRTLARLLERSLSGRTALTAAVSPFEAQTARGLGSASAYIPNIARLPRGLRWTGGTGTGDVLLVGRVTAQKDPEFLLRVLRHLQPLAPQARLTWIGSGDARTEARLRNAGVRVTGWMPRAECVQRMAEADVYLHTAAWEGSPITLLEAAVLGTPIVARSIPALDSLGFDPSLRDPRAVARALAAVLSGAAAPVGPAAPRPKDQARAIKAAYAQVVPTAPVLRPVPLPAPAPAPDAISEPVPVQAQALRSRTVETPVRR